MGSLLCRDVPLIACSSVSLYCEGIRKLLKDFKEGNDIHSQLCVFHRTHWGLYKGRHWRQGGQLECFFLVKREIILQWSRNTEQKSDLKYIYSKQVKLLGLDGWFACGKECWESRRGLMFTTWVMRCNPRSKYRCREWDDGFRFSFLNLR